MSCTICDQSGVVTVYAPLSVRAARAGRGGTGYTMVTRCLCSAGSKYPSLREYRPFTDCKCVGAPYDLENLARLREFTSNDRGAVASRGAFAGFNNRTDEEF